MAGSLKNIQIKPLPLPPEAVGLSRSQLKELLQIEESQLYRDTRICSRLAPSGWRHAPGARGYGRNAIEVLWVFRQLVNLLGRKNAVNYLPQVLEDLRNKQSDLAA